MASETGGLAYDTAKQLIASGNVADRLRVAGTDGVRPELLYFLANDESAEVRRLVARNQGTPRQADHILASDRDAGVRSRLADKLAGVLPGMSARQVGQIERLTLDIVHKLAQDQAIEVRRVLSETLKGVPNVPRSLINGLARDVEISVAGPVLRHSPILTDDDLVEIIISGPAQGAIAAIAQRETVSILVSDAIVASNDAEAVTALLRNDSAQIREETLDRVIDQAPLHEPWHQPLVSRPHLPARAALRLAEFVAESLVKQLRRRTDLDATTLDRLAETVRTRLNTVDQATSVRGNGTSLPGKDGERVSPAPLPGEDWDRGRVTSAPLPGEDWVETASAKPPKAALPGEDWFRDEAANGEDKAKERPSDRARKLAKQGKLTETLLTKSLGEGDRAFVLASLAELTGLRFEVVDRIVASRSPRAICALSWYAELSSAFARQAQLQLAQIPHQKVLKSKSADQYPLSESDLRWQIDFFTGQEK